MRVREILERFIEITSLALREKSQERFIELCLERLGVAGELKNFDLEEQELKLVLAMEEELQKRLEEERRKVIREMGELCLKIKGLRAYRPAYPIPQMSFFLDADA
jgi:hypothetical protein